MGTGDTKKNRETDEQPVERISTGSTSSTNSEKEGTAKPKRTRAKRTRSDTENEKIVSGMVTVEEPEKQEEKPKPKPKKTRKKKDADCCKPELTAILNTVSALVASKSEYAFWQLSDEEVEKIVAPLSSILSKNDGFSKLAEHSDSVALITACTTILLPRVLLQTQILKQKKEMKKNARVSTADRTDTEKNSIGTDEQNSGNHGTDKTANQSNAADDENAGSPEPWYGSGLSE